MKRKILFITPYSSRGGSEKYIWNVFMHLQTKGNSAYLFSVQKGILFKDFKYPVNTYYSKYLSRVTLVYKAILRRLFKIDLIEREILRVHKKTQCDFWYLNTVTLPEYAAIAIKHKIPYIVHLHEMMSVYESIDNLLFFTMLENAKLIIACSNSVASSLKTAGISNIIIEYENVDLEMIDFDEQTSKSIKNQLGISCDKFVWIMSGQRSYRKGIDFVPEIAEKLDKNAHLVWIGGSQDRNLSKIVCAILKNKGIKNVTFIDELGEGYYNYLNMANALILTSREDPFPLVMIEAAYLGKPIISFNSGGVKEFINDDQLGLIIENFDVNKISNTMNDISRGNINFNKNKIRERSLEFSLSARMKIWEANIEKYF